MKSFNAHLLRWFLALSLLGICNAYGQNNIFRTGIGGGATSKKISPMGSFIPLPVDLMFFRAMPQDNYVVLNWATASEQNNSHFVVERSSEGSAFQPIQEIDGAGNSQVQLRYQTVDDQPLRGRSYYRLKQVDYNGEYKYSPLAAVYLSNQGSISVYPSLAHDYVNVSLSAQFLPASITFRIVDASGRVAGIQQSAIGESVARKEIRLQLNSLPTGLYLLQAESADGFYLEQRFVVQ